MTNVINDVGSVTTRCSKEIAYFFWKIDGYVFRPQDDNVIWNSPRFTELEGLYQFVLHPNKAKYIALYIKKEWCLICLDGLTYSAGIQNADGTIHIFSKPQTISGDQFGQDYLEYRPTLLNAGKDVAPKGSVTFFMAICLRKCGHPLDLQAVETVQSKTSENKVKEGKSASTGDIRNKRENFDEKSPNEEGLLILSNNFKEFFLKQEECDVTFKIQEKEIPAHKSIIAARSEVFACMFKHDMAERNSGIVNIVDCSAEAFKELLLYLYSGRVEKLSTETVVDLYEAAAKYELHDLKAKCANFVKHHMNKSTFCDFMTLALKHDDTDLVKFSEDFFMTHAKNIMTTKTWQLFLKQNPISANELYIKALNQTES